MLMTGREIELDRIAFERWLAGDVSLGGPIQEAMAIVRDRNRDRLEWIKATTERYARATAELRARMAAQRHAREISPAFIQRKQAELAALMAARKARENLIMARLDKRPTFKGAVALHARERCAIRAAAMIASRATSAAISNGWRQIANTSTRRQERSATGDHCQ